MSVLTIGNREWRSNKLASRFHDEKGQFALTSAREFADCAMSLSTTAARILFHYRPRVPWITMPAFRFLRQRMPAGARVFEWSSGTSTLWFERHCPEVYAVEDNREWYEYVSKQLSRARLLFQSGNEYVNAIAEFPDGYFDVISVDGSERLACYEKADRYLKPGGILLIDNTDTQGEMRTIDASLEERTDYDVHRFPGWIHGTWSPSETTICIRRNTPAKDFSRRKKSS